jgi:hypothetical protein
MKAVKGWMCGCTETCASVKTSNVMGEYVKPCYVVPAALWRQYRMVQKIIKEIIPDVRSLVLESRSYRELLRELDKLDKLERGK